MRTIDIFGVAGRPRMGQQAAAPRAKMLACPMVGSNGLYVLHYFDTPLKDYFGNPARWDFASTFDTTKIDPNDPRCALPPGEVITYACPIGNGKFQITDLLTGKPANVPPGVGNPPDDPLCPGYAARQAAAAAPPPPPPAPAPIPQAPGGGGVVLIPFPVVNQPAAPAPATPPAEVPPAPAEPMAPPSTSITPLAIAGGVGAVGLVTLFATGVLRF